MSVLDWLIQSNHYTENKLERCNYDDDQFFKLYGHISASCAVVIKNGLKGCYFSFGTYKGRDERSFKKIFALFKY